MTVLFYLFAIPAIWWELRVLLSPASTREFLKSYPKNENDKLDLKSASQTQKSLAVCMLFYALWVLIGFFTSQWLLFLIIFIISLIPKKYLLITILDALVSLSVLLTIIINKFHFHADIWHLISNNL